MKKRLTLKYINVDYEIFSDNSDEELNKTKYEN